jgi:hypothetical protein
MLQEITKKYTKILKKKKKKLLYMLFWSKKIFRLVGKMKKLLRLFSVIYGVNFTKKLVELDYMIPK